MDLQEFLSNFDFSYEKDENGTYRLIDLQGANLGDIEGEEFETIEGIIDRLDIYYNDYILRDLEEQADKCFNDYKEALEWTKKNVPEDEWSIELLEYITGEKKLEE